MLLDDHRLPHRAVLSGIVADSACTVGPHVQVRTLAESVEAIGLGSWKLRGSMCKPFEALTAVIEGTWRQAFDQQLSLYPLPEARALLLIDATSLCL